MKKGGVPISEVIGALKKIRQAKNPAIREHESGRPN